VKAYRFLMGNLFLNLGHNVVAYSGAWGEMFGTDFYTFFITITASIFIGLVGAFIAAASVSYFFPSSTKAAAYIVFSGFFWGIWANTALIFTNFTVLTGNIGILMVSIYAGVGVILFVVGITQSELGGWASHD